jgi:transposase
MGCTVLEVWTAPDQRTRPFFPDAFKRVAVATLRGGRRVSQVAVDSELPNRPLHSWIRGDDRGGVAGSGAPASTPPREQVAPARRVGPSPAGQANDITRLRHLSGRSHYSPESSRRRRSNSSL